MYLEEKIKLIPSLLSSFLDIKDMKAKTYWVLDKKFDEFFQVLGGHPQEPVSYEEGLKEIEKLQLKLVLSHPEAGYSTYNK